MRHIPGILVLYHVPFSRQGATTIVDNYSAFKRYSRFSVWEINTEYGFPKELSTLSFDVIVLHYSLFGRGYEYELSDEFYEYLHSCRSSHIISFFQDEYRYCNKRFDFINEFNIQTIYTCLEKEYFDKVYAKYTSAKYIHSYLPGYVSENLISEAQKYYKPMEDRTIDIGYRARRLDFYMGAGAQEKHEIGTRFAGLVKQRNITMQLDIDVEDENRLYGEDWSKFLSNCRGTLGVESGVSIFDVTDEVRIACDNLIRENPAIAFEEVHEKVLKPWENNIFLRTISPRHFEGAAFRVCQILFEGRYSGIMKPYVHYIPMKKDFSNFDEVISSFSDSRLRQEITERAYADLIADPTYSYESFIRDFDDRLTQIGLKPGRKQDADNIQKSLDRDLHMRRLKTLMRNSIYMDFPGRSWLRKVLGKYFR